MMSLPPRLKQSPAPVRGITRWRSRKMGDPRGRGGRDRSGGGVGVWRSAASLPGPEPQLYFQRCVTVRFTSKPRSCKRINAYKVSGKRNKVEGMAMSLLRLSCRDVYRPLTIVQGATSRSPARFLCFDSIIMQEKQKTLCSLISIRLLSPSMLCM